MWDSLETLRIARYWLGGAAALFTLVTVVIQVRMDQLQDARAAEGAAHLRDFERRQGPRSITPEQRDRLVSILKGHKIAPLHISSVMNDPESIQFARQLTDAFKAADLTILAEDMGMFIQPPKGLIVVVRDKANLPVGVDDFTGALAAIGLTLVGSQDADIKNNDIRFIVGHKPLE